MTSIQSGGWEVFSAPFGWKICYFQANHELFYRLTCLKFYTKCLAPTPNYSKKKSISHVCQMAEKNVIFKYFPFLDSSILMVMLCTSHCAVQIRRFERFQYKLLFQNTVRLGCLLYMFLMPAENLPNCVHLYCTQNNVL